MINLQNIKIGKRMGWGFGIILAVMVVATATALYVISDINDQLDRIVRVNNEKIRHANDAIIAANSLYFSIGNIMLAPDDATRSQQMDKIKKDRETYAKAIEAVEKLEETEGGKKIIASAKETIATSRDLNNTVLEAAMAGKAKDVLSIYIDKLIPNNIQSLEAFRKILRYNEERTAFRHAEAKKAGSMAFYVLLVLGIVQVVLATLIGVSTVRGIARPLAESAHIAETVANGDRS